MASPSNSITPSLRLFLIHKKNKFDSIIPESLLPTPLAQSASSMVLANILVGFTPSEITSPKKILKFFLSISEDSDTQELPEAVPQSKNFRMTSFFSSNKPDKTFHFIFTHTVWEHLSPSNYLLNDLKFQ